MYYSLLPFLLLLDMSRFALVYKEVLWRSKITAIRRRLERSRGCKKESGEKREIILNLLASGGMTGDMDDVEIVKRGDYDNFTVMEVRF